MAKHRGSETFNTKIVSTDEYILLAETMVKNGDTIQEAALNIEAIDDLLAIQKMEIIFTSMGFTKTGKRRKNARMIDAIDGRLWQLVNDLRNLKNRKEVAND